MTDKNYQISYKMNRRTAFRGAFNKLKLLTRKIKEGIEERSGFNIITHPYTFCGIGSLRRKIEDLREVGYDKEERRSYIEKEGRRNSIGLCSYVAAPITLAATFLLAEETMQRYIVGGLTIPIVTRFLAPALVLGIFPATSYATYKSDCASRLLHNTAEANRKYKETGKFTLDMENLGIDRVGDEGLISQIAREKFYAAYKELIRI